jgi:hypothetical protein
MRDGLRRFAGSAAYNRCATWAEYTGSSLAWPNGNLRNAEMCFGGYDVEDGDQTPTSTVRGFSNIHGRHTGLPMR